jgi:plastocyanin
MKKMFKNIYKEILALVRMKRAVIVWIVVAALVLAAGIYVYTTKYCVGSCEGSLPAEQAPFNVYAENVIKISGFVFNASEVTITQGEALTWINLDTVQHQLLSDSGNEISSEMLNRGQTYAHTFYNRGTYSYHCAIHPDMHGKIIVE